MTLLYLRKIDATTARDSYRVRLNTGMEIGSIGLQTGAHNEEYWTWGIDTVLPPDREIASDGRGQDLEDCKRQMKNAWHKFSRNPDRLEKFTEMKRAAQRSWMREPRPLTVSLTEIGGETHPDDLNLWDDEFYSVARLLFQTLAGNRQVWVWNINIPLPQATRRGEAPTKEEAIAQVNEMWTQVRATLSDSDVRKWHELADAASRRRYGRS
jgi:hypothetical protein